MIKITDIDIRHKGWKLKNVPFSFYPWCIQSELSLAKHGQYSKVRTVLKLSGSPDHVLPEIIQIEYTKGKKKMGHFLVSTLFYYYYHYY